MDNNIKLSGQFRKIEPFLYILLVLILLFPILANKYFITQDGPCHLYNGQIFLDYLRNYNTGLNDLYYKSNITFFPYWFGHLFNAFLLWIFPMIVAEKLIYSIYILLFAFFTRTIIKSINKDALFLSYLILPLACNYAFQWGFISFLYGFLFFCWIIVYWIKHSSHFHLKHALIIGLLFTVVYFTHVVFWLFSIITVFILLGFSVLSNASEFKVFIKETKQVLRVFFLLLASILPSALLYYFYFEKNPTIDTGSEFFTVDYLINNFIKLKTIVLVSNKESIFAVLLALMLLVLTTISLVKKIQSKKITVYDGFYLAAFIALIVSIYASMNMIGFLERLQFLPLIFLIFWFASFSFNPKFKIFLIVFSFVITISLVSIRYPIYKRASSTVEELLSAKHLVKDNKTILFLGFSNVGVAPDKKEVTDLMESKFMHLQLFLNSGNYFGVAKPIVVLDNAFACYPQFPYMWKREMCPQMIIQEVNSDAMYANPPDVKVLPFTAKTKGSIDYIALRNYDTKFADYPQTINLFRQLNEGYKEIFVSKTGIVRLFEKIGEDELVLDLKKNDTRENYIKLSKFYFNNGDYLKCAGISEESILKYPLDNEAWAYGGASYTELGQLPKSISYLTQALRLDPNNGFAITNLQLARNIVEADSLIKITSDPQTLISLSARFFTLNLFEKCIVACEKALMVSPDNADAYCNICACYNSMGKWALAVKACKKALEINPDMELAKANLSWASSAL